MGKQLNWDTNGIHEHPCNGKQLKRKERETGIEPATSSLGKWTTIESKEQWRLWHAFLAQEIAAVSCFAIRTPLNGIQMGYSFFLEPQG
jgi:hypothetical protein